MTLRDRDLVSIQEARELVSRAAEAQEKFARFSQEQVDAVVEACANAAASASEQLARTAVEETGFGNVPDKITKNRFAAVDLLRAIRGMRTVGILREDKENGIVEVATPVGVVAAIVPSTNPTSTAIYKTLIALKARNGIVLSPHPTAARCICQTADVLIRAALAAGAPEGLIGCMSQPTLQGTQELMRHRAISVILATGGTGLVRAAYSSGKPAYGVGPGNVPAFIERTADVKKAVADILAGKTFDYGTICSSEQSIVAEQPIATQALEECVKQGCYLLSAEEAKRVGELVYRPGAHTPNPQIVGKPATILAEMAGVKVPPGTRVLLAQLEHVGREYPLSAEKLSPILAFYTTPNLAGGIDLCKRLLQFGGLGHTCSIHSQNDAAVREFGQAVPAFRVCVNTSAVHGSTGYSTRLFPAMTLGCGALGGNITSDNISPHHLMNIKRIAWESRPVEHRTVPAEQRLAGAASSAAPAEPPAAPATAAMAPIGAATILAPDRTLIAKIVERVFTERGIPRSSAPVAESVGGPSASTVSSTPSTAEALPSTPAQAKTENPSPAVDKLTAPPKLAVTVAAFICETDVRMAMTRGEKIFFGPKTIITPSARDYASEHDILIETDQIPSAVPSAD